MCNLLWISLYHRLSEEKCDDFCSCLLAPRNLLRLGDLVVNHKHDMFFQLICTFFTFGCLELGLYWVMNYISCGFPIPLKLIIVVKGLLAWTFRNEILLDICGLSKVWGLRRFSARFLFLVISQHLFLHQCFSVFER